MQFKLNMFFLFLKVEENRNKFRASTFYNKTVISLLTAVVVTAISITAFTPLSEEARLLKTFILKSFLRYLTT